MAWDQRKAERITFSRGYGVSIMAIDGTWRRACKMHDISATGASLQVEGSIEGLALKEFFLVLSESGHVFRRCQLIRVNGDELGVMFVFKTETKKMQRNSAPA